MLKHLKKLTIVSMGCVLYAIAIAIFLNPNRIAPGGVSGISIMLNYLFNTPIGGTILVINIPLFLISFKHLGKKFVFVTIYASILSSIIIDLLSNFVEYKTDPLLSAIYAGIFLGLGIGLLFTQEASTGGTEIVSRLVLNKKPHFSVGQIMILVDAIIIIAGIFVFQNVDSALYAIISITISAKVIDMILEGLNVARMVYIISDESEEILRLLTSLLGRGVTVLNGKGAYTGKDKKVLLCAVRRHQITPLKELVKSTDPTSFVIVAEAREVLGSGFLDLSNNKI